MAFQVERMSHPNLEPRKSTSDCLCHAPDHTHPHEHQHESRRAHLTLIAVNALVTLLLLATAFLGGYYYLTSPTQSPPAITSTEADAIRISTEVLTLTDRVPKWTLIPADEEQALIQLYERARPAVVKVVVAHRGQVDLSHSEPRGDTMGSGVIFDLKGHIVTNHHLVDRAADVVVQLAGGRVVKAKVLGQDPGTDLAVLGIDMPAAELTVAPFADSDELRVGQVAIVIGHPFGLDSSLTVGHISGLGRMTPTRDKCFY